MLLKANTRSIINLPMYADTISLSGGGLVCDPKALLPANISQVKSDNRLRINLVDELENPAIVSSDCLLVKKTPLPPPVL